MNKYSPEIATLRMDIEREVKRKIRTPYDFEFLAGVIWERLHENLSPTTLKRLWGYIDGADTTRRTTLCLLSQFLGFADWETYLASLATRTDIESAAFDGEGIHIDDLQKGDRVEVTWLPNRRCVFRYEGEAHFVVEESENAKLHVGDSFDANNPVDRQAHIACHEEYSEYVQSQWAVRDSLMNLYPENDPLREQLWQLWVRREGEMNTELLSLLSAKLK